MPNRPVHVHSPTPSVVTIGTFDGVHLGHQALVHRARALAHTVPGARVVAMAFDPNPATVTSPARAPARLTTFERRRELLLAAGADEVVKLEPTSELLSVEPADFITTCLRQHHPIAFVEGGDFRFGRRRAGDIAFLQQLGDKHDFRVEVVDNVEVPLTNLQIAPARSTVVRELLTSGRVRDAAIVLGRPYELDGVVVHGERRGRTIGFPTANIVSPCLPPADGVYAGLADLPDGRVLIAAVSVGSKPTFDGAGRTVEAYLIRPDAGNDASWSPIDGLPEYEWPIRLRLLAWVREQVKFHSLDALIAQIERDVHAITRIATEHLDHIAHQSSRSPFTYHRTARPEALA